MLIGFNLYSLTSASIPSIENRLVQYYYLLQFVHTHFNNNAQSRAGSCLLMGQQIVQKKTVQRIVQQTQYRRLCSRPRLEDSVADPVYRIVQQTQFRGQCSRPSIEDSVADPVQRILQQTQYRGQCSRPSLEDSVADPVQKIVQQTQFRG